MELLLIVVLALIVFGPQRLPEIMGQVGKAIADFRRATSQLSEEFNQTIQSEINQTRATLEEPLNETRAALNDATSVTSTSPSPSPPPPAASPAEPGQAVGSEGMAAAIGATAGSNSADQWNWEAPMTPVPAAVASPASSNSNANPTSNANPNAALESSAPTTSPPPATDAKPPADVPPPATEPSRDELLPPY
jgi:Tat protein translocase TatB subunit